MIPNTFTIALFQGLNKLNLNKESNLEYAGEFKDPKKLRHIVIPIPEFMKTKLGGFSTTATRIKSNKTHHRNDEATNDDYYQTDRRNRAGSNSTRSTNTGSGYQYQQQDANHNRDLFSSMSANNRESTENVRVSTIATTAYLHRQVTASGGGQRRDNSAPLTVINTTSAYKEVQNNGRQQKRYDIQQ